MRIGEGCPDAGGGGLQDGGVPRWCPCGAMCEPRRALTCFPRTHLHAIF